LPRKFGAAGGGGKGGVNADFSRVMAAGRRLPAEPRAISRAMCYLRHSAMANEPTIVLTANALNPADLRRLAEAFFRDMVKVVVDVRRGCAAVGGELHADAEQLLLEDGSEQADLWGANYYPGRGAEGCVEFTAMINIRPAQGNASMEIQDPDIRRLVREVVLRVLGRGEPL
jgi:hypothetical protein